MTLFLSMYHVVSGSTGLKVRLADKVLQSCQSKICTGVGSSYPVSFSPQGPRLFSLLRWKLQYSFSLRFDCGSNWGLGETTIRCKTTSVGGVNSCPTLLCWFRLVFASVLHWLVLTEHLVFCAMHLQLSKGKNKIGMLLWSCLPQCWISFSLCTLLKSEGWSVSCS